MVTLGILHFVIVGMPQRSFRPFQTPR